MARSSEKRYGSPQILLEYANRMCLRSFSGGAKKVGRFILSATRIAPPWNHLVWTGADTGGTKVRDHPKVVESCASAAMVGISYIGT